jgi:hypothetical protein
MRALLGTAAITAGALVGANAAAAAAADPDFTQVGRYQVDFDLGGETAAETFAIENTRMYVTNVAADTPGIENTLDVVDISDPAAPVLLQRVELPGGPNSVDVKNGLIAVAVDGAPKTEPGTVRFFTATLTGVNFLRDVEVGAVPDMVVFTRRGGEVLVANEGEPSGYNGQGVDPEGSVSIIDTTGITNTKRPVRTRTVDFRAFNAGAPRHGELPPGIRLNGPGATVAQDLEPEYIALSRNRRTAYVSLQENNAVAAIDIAGARVKRIVSMGLRDHSAPGSGLDASDQDGAINIANWPVKGIPMPDGIDAFRVNGQEYIITANEGDAREWPGFPLTNGQPSPASDTGRLAGVFNNARTQVPGFEASFLRASSRLGRLNLSLTDGVTGPANDRVLVQPHSLGSRSVSIVRPDGTLVWDSGDAFEQTIAAADAERVLAGLPRVFNVSNSTNTFDNRSDDKGPEPEDVAVGKIDGRTYAFVALERVGGLMVLDITNPAEGRVVRWVTTRDYAAAPATTDSGPEIVKFLPAAKSPTGEPLVVFSNEVSGSIVFLSPLG